MYLMNFDVFKNQSDVLYFSKKNYKLIFYILLFYFFISAPILILLVFIFKDITVLIGGLCTFVFLSVLIFVGDITVFNKKIIITRDKIIIFNILGKIIKTIPINNGLKVLFSPFVFVFQYEKTYLKISYEQDNEQIYFVLKKNFGIKFLDNSNIEENTRFFKIFGKITISIVSLLNLFIFFFTIYHRNEFFSYFYVYMGQQCLHHEAKIYNTSQIKMNTERVHLLKAYNYYKKACILNINQDKKIYEYIIRYAYWNKKEKDLKNFLEFERYLYPEK